MEGTIAVIGVFGSIPLIVWITYYFRTKAHMRTSKVLEKMVERGDAITPETVRALGVKGRSPHADLKTGMILIAIAFAFLFFGEVIPDDEAPAIVMGVASFPFLVGLALIGFWFFVGRKEITD